MLTTDACSLEFDFSVDSEPQGFSFSYVSAAEEYAGDGVNDWFGFFLDGTNIAVIPGTITPVSVNTIKCGFPFNAVGTNCNLLVNNIGVLFDPGADGFIVPLSASIPSLSLGMHHTLKIAIADVLDTNIDSHVLIKAVLWSMTNSRLKVPVLLPTVVRVLRPAAVPVLIRVLHPASVPVFLPASVPVLLPAAVPALLQQMRVSSVTCPL
jgi:hypothetical protein